MTSFTEKINKILLEKSLESHRKCRIALSFKSKVNLYLESLINKQQACEEEFPDEDWEILDTEIMTFIKLFEGNHEEAELFKRRTMELYNEGLNDMLFDGLGDDGTAVIWGNLMKNYNKMYDRIRIGVSLYGNPMV